MQEIKKHRPNPPQLRAQAAAPRELWGLPRAPQHMGTQVSWGDRGRVSGAFPGAWGVSAGSLEGFRSNTRPGCMTRWPELRPQGGTEEPSVVCERVRTCVRARVFTRT